MAAHIVNTRAPSAAHERNRLMPTNPATPLVASLSDMADLLHVFTKAINDPIEVDGELCAVIKIDDLCTSFVEDYYPALRAL